jgi:hypothetical protein
MPRDPADEQAKGEEKKPGGRMTRVLATVFGAILAPILVAVTVKWADPQLWRSTQATAPAPEPLKGRVDLQLHDEADPKRRNCSLDDPGILPLRVGDQFCIRAELNRPAYLYVLRIDSDGQADLIYPRDPATKARPAEERPVQSLRRPEALNKHYKLPEGPAGMATVVLLALEEKLPPTVDLAAELEGLPAQRHKGEALVRFRDGEVVRDESTRGHPWEETEAGDPLLVTQDRLRQLWQRHGGHLHAVSFATRER